MKFTKNKGMYLGVVAIVLAVFNVVAFLIPFVMTAGFWIGYSFAMLAIVLTAIVIFYALGREGMKSKFYGIPLVLLVWPYLLVQLAISLVEMSLPIIPFKYEIVLNIIVLAIVLIGLIGINVGTDEVERLDEKIKDKRLYIKSLEGDIEVLITKTPDVSLQKKLKALAERIRYSDPMSSPQLASLENLIDAKVVELRESFSQEKSVTDTLCEEIQQLFAERNRKCKLLK